MESIAVVIMTWLSIMEYMCNRLPLIYPVCRSNNLTVFFITYQRNFNSLDTTGTTSAAGTAYPSGASAFTMVFCGVRVAQCFLCGFLWIIVCLFVALCCLYGFWFSFWDLQTFFNVSYIFQTTLVTLVGTYLFWYQAIKL